MRTLTTTYLGMLDATAGCSKNPKPPARSEERRSGIDPPSPILDSFQRQGEKKGFRFVSVTVTKKSNIV